jgi:hypothetical protein
MAIFFDDTENSSVSDLERLCNNPNKKAFFDQKIIKKKELASATSVIILQVTPSKSSHRRALNCLPETLSGWPKLISPFFVSISRI